MKKYIAYYWSSTPIQAENDFGIKAQQETVKTFLHGKGELVAEYSGVGGGQGNGRPVVAEYVDIDSSSGSSQPQLLYALAHAQRINGLLVVATWNRLSRHESFFADLKARGIDFVCADGTEKWIKST